VTKQKNLEMLTEDWEWRCRSDAGWKCC